MSRPLAFVALFTLASCHACDRGAPPAKILEEITVDVREGSGLVVLGGGRFLVVDDEDGVQLVDKNAVRVIVPLTDLEGVTRIGDQFLAIEEQSGIVWGFDLAGTVTRRGFLVHPPSAQKPHKNRGWEGLAFLPAKLAADQKDHLIAVHEGAPKAVALFAWPSLEPERTYVPGPFPDPVLDRVLDDLSDIAVDESNGELLLLSDKSRRIVRVRLGLGDPLTATLVRVTELPVAAHEKPEGIAYDGAGGLWVVTDVTGRLFRIASP